MQGKEGKIAPLKTSVILLLLISFAPGLMAQSRDFKVDISVSYGLAIPVGGFRKIAPAKNIEVLPSGTPGVWIYNIYGIVKDGNSYALNGQFGSFNISYLLEHHWLVALEAHYSTNPVDTEAFLDYANTIVTPSVKTVSSSDYNVTAWGAGFGYEFHSKKFRFRIIPIIGQAIISSPDYSFEWLTVPFNFDVIDLRNSVLLGLHSSIGYDSESKFYGSVKFDFDSANFAYSVKMRSPGLPFPYTDDDSITYRLLKLGLTLGARL